MKTWGERERAREREKERERNKEKDLKVDQMQNCLNIVEDFLKFKRAARERTKHNF